MNQDEVFQIVRKKTKAFSFAMPGSKKVYHMPLMKDLSMGETMQMSEFADEKDPQILDAKALVFIYGLFSKYVPEVANLTQDEFGELFQAYQEASGMTVGESAASSD